jgi:hypothetical protein
MKIVVKPEDKTLTIADLDSLFQTNPSLSMILNARAFETWESMPRFSANNLKIKSTEEIDFDLPIHRLSTPDYIYEGQTRENRPYGVGRLLATASGNIYEGQLNGEMKHGYGRVIFG